MPYLGMPYTRTLVPDEGGFVAEVLELPGCISEGDTPDKAYRNLEDAMAGYIAIELEDGNPIPEPLGNKEYSGRLLLRLSGSLHREAAHRAMHEGVSLNQWIGQSVASALGAASLADELAAKVLAGIKFKIAMGAVAEMTFVDVGEESTPAETTTSWLRSSSLGRGTPSHSHPVGGQLHTAVAERES